MNHIRRNSFIVIFFCLISAYILSTFSSQAKERYNTYKEPLPATPKVENPMAGIAADFSVDPDVFTTHLPIIILDTKNERPPIIPIEGPSTDIEPNVAGTVGVINTGGMNSLRDEPEATSLITMKRRGHSSMSYEKAQYLMKLLTQSGQENHLPLLGMGADNEWILNGSMADKSMMRNYMVYRISSEFIPFTPNAKYCEVVYKENGEYYYEGVYLLIEKIEQGAHRVNISTYKPSFPYTSYILRRDRFDETNIIFETHAIKMGYTDKYIGLIYPAQKNITEDTIQYIQNDLDKIEKILYSDNFTEYSVYPRYIDVDSFVDYFLANEFFGSYDAGWHSTYMYKEIGGKLHIGPMWDLDNAIDNYILEPLNVAVTTFQERPWFDRLMLDSAYVSRLESRYAQLRRGSLSDAHIVSVIDEIEAYLGSSIDREWTRWNHIYTGEHEYSLQPYQDSEGDMLVRYTDNQKQEIYRLKRNIIQHGRAIGGRLQVLQNSTVTTTAATRYMGYALLLVMICFIVSAVYTARH